MIEWKTVWVICRPEALPLYLTHDGLWRLIGLETWKFASKAEADAEAETWIWSTQVEELEYLARVIP